MSTATIATIEVVGLAMLGGAIGCFFTLAGVLLIIYIGIHLIEFIENKLDEIKEEKSNSSTEQAIVNEKAQNIIKTVNNDLNNINTK